MRSFLESGKNHRESKPNRKRTKSKRFDTFNWFVDEKAAELTPLVGMVYVVIWRHAIGGRATLSYRQIQDRIGISKTSVYNSITKLRRAKLIKTKSTAYGVEFKILDPT